jgi:hypothetical protein
MLVAVGDIDAVNPAPAFFPNSAEPGVQSGAYLLYLKKEIIPIPSPSLLKFAWFCPFSSRLLLYLQGIRNVNGLYSKKKQNLIHRKFCKSMDYFHGETL